MRDWLGGFSLVLRLLGVYFATAAAAILANFHYQPSSLFYGLAAFGLGLAAAAAPFFRALRSSG